jgi:hypothetical protein
MTLLLRLQVIHSDSRMPPKVVRSADKMAETHSQPCSLILLFFESLDRARDKLRREAVLDAPPEADCSNDKIKKENWECFILKLF